MSKVAFKPGNMIYPLPAVMVTCGDIDDVSNIITIAWTGTVCSDPPMCYISVRKERFSHDLIVQSREFVINIIFFGFIALGAPTAIQDVITGLALLIVVTLTTKITKGEIIK